MRKTVKEKREELGLSQCEVSKRTGINYSTYVKKERGLRKWYYNEVIKICEVFSCDINDLKL